MLYFCSKIFRIFFNEVFPTLPVIAKIFALQFSLLSLANLFRKVIELSTLSNITLICGRYEGVDQRFVDSYVDEEISIGDFIISGGEYAAMILIDAIARNIPGTIGNQDSVTKDTFSNGLLKGPAYTRPEKFENKSVPDVLLSGNHQEIKEWRGKKSLIQTYLRRPDLLNDVKLTNKQKKLLEDWESKDIL